MRPHQCAGKLAGHIRGNRSDTDHGARSGPPSDPISPDPLQDGLPEDSCLVAGSASRRTRAIFGELVTATRAATIGHDQHDLTDKRQQLQPEGGQGL